MTKNRSDHSAHKTAEKNVVQIQVINDKYDVDKDSETNGLKNET